VQITVARLYHPALWKILYSYRVVLVTLRIFELAFRALRYVFFRAPLLLAWTRLPILRDRRPPHKDLGYVLAPVRDRASMAVGVGELGSDLALAQSAAHVSEIKSAVVYGQNPPPRVWSVFGCFLRGFFTDMGPAFIKFGQILSMREEVPPTVKRELQLLQDRLPPMSYKQVKKILQRELDRPIEEVFEWVEEAPIAAASLSQVHRAKLRKEQEEVALKVQRPHLQGIVALDTVIVCDVFFSLVNLLLPLLRKTTNTDIFTKSYRETLAKEVDFVLEERNQTAFRKLVMKHPIYSQGTKIARTYREYTTTKLLTMELVKNYHRLDRILDDLSPEQLWGFAATKLEGLPDELPLHLVWVQLALELEGLSHWGLSHGDVHLGNLYALEPQDEGDKWKVFLCDFGMMIEETEDDRLLALRVGLSLCYFWDGRLTGKALGTIPGNETKTRELAKFSDHMSTVLAKYWGETKEGAEKTWYPVVQRGTSTNIVSAIMYGAATMGLEVPPFGWMLFKNIDYVVSLLLSVWTSFNPGDMWAPHCKKLVKDLVLYDLTTKNITTMIDSLPDTLSNLRPYDRWQILNGLWNDGVVTPMAVWSDDHWDTRGLFGGDGSRPGQQVASGETIGEEGKS
jgi:hypothetical protein